MLQAPPSWLLGRYPRLAVATFAYSTLGCGEQRLCCPALCTIAFTLTVSASYLYIEAVKVKCLTQVTNSDKLRLGAVEHTTSCLKLLRRTSRHATHVYQWCTLWCPGCIPTITLSGRGG